MLCRIRQPGSPFRSDVRLIAVDRPGYGRTDFSKNAIINWPKDISSLADALKIEKFILFAPSGGGPFALACAWQIPDRLLSFGLFGSIGPYKEESIQGSLKSLQLLWRISKPLHFLVKFQMRIMGAIAKSNPQKMALKLRDLELSDKDKVIFDRPEITEIFVKDFPEAYKQNGAGSAYDTTLPMNWPIPLNEIKIHAHVWHAENDILVGNMAKYISDQLPSSTLHVIKNSGHLWILDHMDEVLKTLIEKK